MTQKLFITKDSIGNLLGNYRPELEFWVTFDTIILHSFCTNFVRSSKMGLLGSTDEMMFFPQSNKCHGFRIQPIFEVF